MKKIFAVLAGALALALAVPAEASWNIRQKGSGATVWTDGSVEVPTGDTGLVVKITDVGTAGTSFVVSHKKGNVVKVYAVSNTSTGNSTPSVLHFKIGDGSTSGTYTPISAMTLSVSTTAGRIASATPTLTGIGTTRVNVGQGEIIAIYSDGAGLAQDATIVIVIE